MNHAPLGLKTSVLGDLCRTTRALPQAHDLRPVGAEEGVPPDESRTLPRHAGRRGLEPTRKAGRFSLYFGLDMTTLARVGKLALEDGTVFTGTAFGADGTSHGEAVFNTSLTG